MVLESIAKNRIIGKLTASGAILGTLWAVFDSFINNVQIPAEGYALIGLIVGGATTFLFMDETQNT